MPHTSARRGSTDEDQGAQALVEIDGVDCGAESSADTDVDALNKRVSAVRRGLLYGTPADVVGLVNATVPALAKRAAERFVAKSS